MRALGFPTKKADVVALVEAHGTNDGSVSFDLFLAMMKERYGERDPDDEIFKAFELFDNDHSGKISLQNMQQVARDLGEDISTDELQLMIQEFDHDLDGHISQDEFFSIMRSSDG